MTTTALSIRLDQDLAEHIRQAAADADVSINKQIILMLTNASATEELTLKFRIPKETIRAAVMHNMDNDEGLTPQIEVDDDLISWAKYMLRNYAGYEEAPIAITVHGENLIIQCNTEILSAVQSYVL